MVREKVLYLDCSSGVSGDMFAGAMLGLGVDPQRLCEALKSLALDDFEIKIYDTVKHGISATKFDVILKQHGDGHTHTHRNFADICAMIEKSPLSDRVKALSKKIFGIVAQAESKVHRVPVDEVRFHEVGAADSIADIVAAAFCMEELGVERVVCSPLREGSGQVVCAHGTLPVPVPATAEILAAVSVPFYTTGTRGELITPTGAAIIAGICGGFGTMPLMTVERIGCGAGTKEFDHPNLLRAFLGQAEQSLFGDVQTPAESCVEVLETCVDDTTGEALGSCLEALFAAGVRDAYFSPVFMKKGRPGYLLTALCDKERVRQAAEIIFERTGSIGLRVRTSRRIVMQREIQKVATPYGEIPVKFSSFGGVKKYKAEQADVEKAAREHGVSPSEIYAGVAAAIDKNT